jgi:hypothetical protein
MTKINNLLKGLLVSIFAFTAVELMAQPTVSIVTQPMNLVACYDTQNSPLTTQGSVQAGFPTWILRYQWFKDGVALGSSSTFGGLQLGRLRYPQSGRYNCAVWATEGAFSSATVVSNSVDVNVLGTHVVTNQSRRIYANIGDVVTLSFDAHIQGQYGAGNPSYQPTIQWWRGSSTLTDGANIAGSKSNHLSLRVASASDYSASYQARITGQCGTINTELISIERFPTVNINRQPVNVTACENATVSASVDAVASNGAPLLYQWYVGTTPLADNASPLVSGAKSATLTWAATASLSGIYCMISTNDGLATANSNSITLTANKAPIFTSQPQSVSVQASKSFTLMGEATGSTTYTWYRDNMMITGANSNSLTVASASTSDAGVYRLVAANDCGSATSTSATVTVTQGLVASLEPINFEKIGLHQNTPNPFNDVTNLNFTLGESSEVRVVLVDLYGKQISEIFSGRANAGLNTYSISANKLGLSAGVYYLHLVSNGLNQMKQITVVR